MENNILLGGPGCGPCKRVKNHLDDKGVDYTYIDTSTEEGLALAKDWCVRAVPSMSINGYIVTGDTKIMEAFK